MLHTLRNRPPDQPSQLSERQQRIYSFLHDNPIGVLATVTPNGDPHGTVIYFSIDKNFSISFLTKKDTRKYDNIRHNGHVMLTAFDPYTQTTAQVTGIAAAVEDSYELNAIAGAVLRASLNTGDARLLPINKLQAGDYAAFKIDPAQIRIATYARPEPGDYSELFETIESFELKQDS